MIEVIPISVTLTDMKALLGFVKEKSGQDISRAVDQAKLPLKSPQALVAILETFRRNDMAPIRALISGAAPSTLDHVSYSFIVAADERVFRDLIALTSRTLALTHSGNLGILSGTLKEWKLVISTVLTGTVTDDLREVFTIIFSFFESCGLRDIWSDFQKKSYGHNLLSLVKL